MWGAFSAFVWPDPVPKLNTVSVGSVAVKKVEFTAGGQVVKFSSKKLPVPLEIELLDRDTSRIINKFVYEKKKNLYKNRLLYDALELWCAKEAVYKLFDLPGLSFKDEILILNRKLNGQLILLEGIVQRNIPKKNFMVKTLICLPYSTVRISAKGK